MSCGCNSASLALVHEVGVSTTPGGLQLTQEVRAVPREWGGDYARAGDQGPKGPSCQAQPGRKPDKLCSGLELGGGEGSCAKFPSLPSRPSELAGFDPERPVLLATRILLSLCADPPGFSGRKQAALAQDECL